MFFCASPPGCCSRLDETHTSPTRRPPTPRRSRPSPTRCLQRDLLRQRHLLRAGRPRIGGAPPRPRTGRRRAPRRPGARRRPGHQRRADAHRARVARCRRASRRRHRHPGRRRTPDPRSTRDRPWRTGRGRGDGAHDHRRARSPADGPAVPWRDDAPVRERTGRPSRARGDYRALGLTVKLEVLGTVRGIPESIGVTLYRITQEALTNTLKHGQASTATVRLRYRERSLELDVVDDGRAASSGSSGALRLEAPGARPSGYARACRPARRRSRTRPAPPRWLPRPGGPSRPAVRRRMAAPVPSRPRHPGEPMTRSTRVLLVDDQDLVRAGFRIILDTAEHMERRRGGPRRLEAVTSPRRCAPTSSSWTSRCRASTASARQNASCPCPVSRWPSSSSPPSGGTSTCSGRSARGPAASCSRPPHPRSSSTPSAWCTGATPCSPRS